MSGDSATSPTWRDYVGEDIPPVPPDTSPAPVSKISNVPNGGSHGMAFHGSRLPTLGRDPFQDLLQRALRYSHDMFAHAPAGFRPRFAAILAIGVIVTAGYRGIAVPIDTFRTTADSQVAPIVQRELQRCIAAAAGAPAAGGQTPAQPAAAPGAGAAGCPLAAPAGAKNVTWTVPTDPVLAHQVVPLWRDRGYGLARVAFLLSYDEPSGAHYSMERVEHVVVDLQSGADGRISATSFRWWSVMGGRP